MSKQVVNIMKNLGITLLFPAIATGIGYLFNIWKFQDTNIVVTYILSVLLISVFTDGYLYGLLGTIISIILFNWFFTAPYFSLDVFDSTYIITFVIMSITALITSALTTKVKKAAISSKKRERENHALYKMTNLFTDAENAHEISSITVKTISNILSCDVCCVCYNDNGDLEDTFIQQKGEEQIRRELDNKEELKKRIENLHGPYDIDSHYYNYPIYGQNSELAIIGIPKESAVNMNDEQNRMIFAIIESTALALERLRSVKAQLEIREEAMRERYRGNLLRSISHDIRTPLSGIMGSVEMLMNMTDKEDPKYSIEEGVYQDADWLHSLVENILNLTKLHDGHMNLTMEQEAVEEVIGSAIRVIEKRFPDRNIEVNIPDELIMAKMDAKLISQVVVNLLDNAVKHTPFDKEISVSVNKEADFVKFVVADNGCGIAESDLPKIFEMFYTTHGKSTDSHRGIGLGLAICQSIVEAHGGTIYAENRADGGAQFIFTLPVGDNKDDREI